MTNIEVAIKHFERKSEMYKGKLTAHEVLEVLQFLKQCEKEDLKLTGIGYIIYDGKMEDSEIDRYEGGFAISRDKKR